MPDAFLFAVISSIAVTMVGTVWFMNGVCNLSRQRLDDELADVKHELRVSLTKADALQKALDKLALPA